MPKNLFSSDGLEPEFSEPFNAYRQDPTPHNATQMLNVLKPVITSGVKSHVGKPNAISNSHARRLALQAVRSYDPQKGTRLSTHVHNHLQGLRRITRQNTSGVRVPERIAIDSAQLQSAEAELQDELGREPTMSELADHTRMSIKRITKVRQYQPGVAYSTIHRDNVEGAGWDPAVQQPASDAWLRLLHGEQDPINQKIMEWTLGLYGAPQLPNQEIARRLDITPGAVSQRKARLQQLIDEGGNYARF